MRSEVKRVRLCFVSILFEIYTKKGIITKNNDEAVSGITQVFELFYEKLRQTVRWYYRRVKRDLSFK